METPIRTLYGKPHVEIPPGVARRLELREGERLVVTETDTGFCVSIFDGDEYRALTTAREALADNQRVYDSLDDGKGES